MAGRTLALIVLALAVVAFVAGIFGLIGPNASMLLAGLGLLLMLGGLGFLLTVTRPWRFSTPHPYAIGMAIAALVLHAYQHVWQGTGDPAMWMVLWAMAPYVLGVSLSTFADLRASVIAGVALALALDVWGHYAVFINPPGSTAALALLFIPLWSTIIVVPLATFIAWFISQRRRS